MREESLYGVGCHRDFQVEIGKPVSRGFYDFSAHHGQAISRNLLLAHLSTHHFVDRAERLSSLTGCYAEPCGQINRSPRNSMPLNNRMDMMNMAMKSTPERKLAINLIFSGVDEARKYANATLFVRVWRIACHSAI